MWDHSIRIQYPAISIQKTMQEAIQGKISLSCSDLSEMNWIEGHTHGAIKSHTVDVWLGDLTKVKEGEIILLKNKLPFDKAEKADRFRSTKDSERYILAHGMLQGIIKKYTGEEKVEIAFTKYRKPYLPKFPNLSFNMSHSGDRILLAFRFDGAPIGVDIEYAKPGLDIHLITASYYHIDEQEAVLNSKNPQLFYKLWTRKEALLKAMEVGLTEEIKKINVMKSATSFLGLGVLDDFNGKDFDIQSFMLGQHYFASLATIKSSLTYSFVNF